MRLARTLFLLAATAIAALAFTASANATVEVVNETSGLHCPEVQTNGTHTVTGGCHLIAATEAGTTADLAVHGATGETLFSRCVNSFDGRVHETGDAYIFNQVLSEPGEGVPCNRTACDEASGTKIPWPANLYELNPGVTDFQVTFCVRQVSPAGPNTPCTVSLPVTVEDAPTHTYEFRAAATNPRPVRCSQLASVSLTGHWVTSVASANDIEIIH